MSDHYTYVFVRADLPVDQQIIQVGHACHDAILLLDHFGSDTPNIVLFVVKDESELIEVSRRIRESGVRFAMFFEPDHDHGFTAIATVPIRRDNELRTVFSEYELYAGVRVPAPA